MTRRSFRWMLSMCLLMCASPLWAEDLETIDSDTAQKFGAKLSEAAAKLKDPVVRITPDAAAAQGVHRDRDVALLLVPKKDLHEGDQGDAQLVGQDPGAGLAYLFAHQVVPVVDGKSIDGSKLYDITVDSDEGEQSVRCMLLTVRRISEDDWRLYVYGQDKKPLLEVPFQPGQGPGDEPLAIECKNVEGFEGEVVVTVFGKYQASFKVRYEPQ